MARSAKLGSRGAANVSRVMWFASDSIEFVSIGVNEVAAFGYPRERWFE
jgi:hypothetical protein